MDAKKLALLVGALTTAAVTAAMAKHMSSQTVAPQVMAAIAPAPVGPSVLVATKPLPVGTILTPDSFQFKPWPKENIDNAYFVQGAANVDPGKMAGWVVRNAVTAGQPLTQGSLVSPHDRGFLAAALTPGMRAVSVAVSGATAVAGFVFPGDRVDLVLSEEIQTGAPQTLKAAETISRNVRVLATDQRTDNAPTPDGKTAVTNYTLVTLEATPKLAERIAVAQKLGTLSLSLRPLADSAEELQKAIAAGDLPAGAGPQPQPSTALQLASQPQDGGTSYTTGSEVSRFARVGTAPGAAGQGLAAGPLNAAGAAMPGAAAPGAAPAYHGPTVRVSRGGTVTNTPVLGG